MARKKHPQHFPPPPKPIRGRAAAIVALSRVLEDVEATPARLQCAVSMLDAKDHRRPELRDLATLLGVIFRRIGALRDSLKAARHG